MPHTETHAYRIPHVDVTNMQICKYVAADSTSVKNDTSITAENGVISTINAWNDANFDKPYGPFQSAHISMEDSSDMKIYVLREAGEAACIDENIVDHWRIENHNRQYARITNDDAENEAASTCILSNSDHIYEEIKAIKESRTFMEMLLLPQHKMCKECARTYFNPVYTDRLIYSKKSLLAVEVVLCQCDDVSCFKHLAFREGVNRSLHSQYDRNLHDCMLIYNYTKANAAGIFYSHCWPQDVFDVKSVLKPNIYVINRTCNAIVNTQLYHRYINNYHTRISRAGCIPMIFYCERDTIVSHTKHISYNNNSLQKSLTKNDDIDDYRRNRSSLLLLEPLLLMPESTSCVRGKNNNRILQSEEAKIVRIVIIYALSFFILASITFYVVYFT